jgi:hypothetical protein
VIYANSLADHDRKLRDVFRRLRKNNLKLQPDKCEFLRKEVTFLGHKISESGVEPDNRNRKVPKIVHGKTIEELGIGRIL